MHRDACHDQQQQFTVDWQVCVYFGRPRLTSKLIASRGGVWKYANTQRALYPNGGCISTGGAVLPRVVITAPFIRPTLMPVTQSLGNSYLFLKRVLSHGESSEEVPQFLWLFSQPFHLKEIQSLELNLSPLLTYASKWQLARRGGLVVWLLTFIHPASLRCRRLRCCIDLAH